LRRNGWPESIGISGRFRSESVAGFVRNTHLHGNAHIAPLVLPLTRHLVALMFMNSRRAGEKATFNGQSFGQRLHGVEFFRFHVVPFLHSQDGGVDVRFLE
jgi:hypothetical protein